MMSPKTSYIEACLKPGGFIYWLERTYQIEQPAEVEVDPLLIWVRDTETMDLCPIKMEELLLVEGNPPLFAPTLLQLKEDIKVQWMPASSPPATGLPDHLLRRASQIVSTIETMDRLLASQERLALDQNRKFDYTATLKKLLEHLAEPLGLTNYYKYRRLYRQNEGNPVRIAAALRRKTYNQSQMSRAQLHFIDTMILRFYAGQRTIRPKPKKLYEIIQSAFNRTEGLWLNPDKCPGSGVEHVVTELLDPRLSLQSILDNPEKAGWLSPIRLPSQSWFYGYLHWFRTQPGQGRELIVGRHGQEMWERESMVFDSFVQRAVHTSQYVFADHWLIDAFTVDEATRSQLKRLWLTLLIDVYSRSVLGLALLYETPCIESIQAALQHAIWPKRSHQALGIEQEWICYGIPQQLYLDNAWAHHSHSLEQLARDISQGGKYNSIDLVFRPPYTGRYGALIERLFGNFSGQFQELLPGAIMAGQPKAIANATRQACLLYQDIYKIVHQLIVRYQHTPHRELNGMTPHQKWLEGYQLGYAGWPPPLTEAMARLFWRRSTETRVINRKGISVFDLHYWSPELELWPRKDGNGRSIRYGFSYQPADISRLAIFRDQTWMGDVTAKQLRRADGSTRSVSLWEHEMGQDLARNRSRASQDWLAFVTELNELGQQRTTEKKRANQKAKHRAGPMTEVIQTGSTAGTEPDYTELLRRFVSQTTPGAER
jgi:transposase InsO family protein